MDSDEEVSEILPSFSSAYSACMQCYILYMYCTCLSTLYMYMYLHMYAGLLLHTELIVSLSVSQQELGPRRKRKLFSPFQGMVSRCFEPHLNVYITSQDR